MTLLEQTEKQLYILLANAVKDFHSNTVAISGGLDSSIATYLMGSKIKRGIAIITEDFLAKDLTYCQMISKELDIPLEIKKVDLKEIFDAIENTIKILKNFNDIEIRNNIVIYLTLKSVKEHGEKSLLTGDGADELFAGYYFLLNKENHEIKMDLNRMRKIMHFPSIEIAEKMGITIESPFLDKNIIEFSKQLEVNQLVRKENGKKHGKWILRKTFENKLPPKIIWRDKSPMQDGAGTSGLISMFDTLIDNNTFHKKKNEIMDKDDVKIRTKESLYYYEVFRKNFGKPKAARNTSCPYCKYLIQDGSKFCRMCGAFPL